MILLFPITDESEGCILWGKIVGGRGDDSISPITESQCRNGSTKYTFPVCVASKNIGSPGRPVWEREMAYVSTFVNPEERYDGKLGDVVKLLRRWEPVLVIGTHNSHITKKNGKEYLVHEVTAQMVLPVAWLYDIILALFTQVVNKANPPRLKPMKEAPPPKSKKQMPQTARVNVLDDEEWGRFE